jgi:hypothetical protein
MIAKLRDRHCWMWWVLAPLLLAVVAIAWRARRETVMMERLPETLLQNVSR